MEYLVSCLDEWLNKTSQSSLRRAFSRWIKQVVLPVRMPGVEFEAMNDLQEVQSMLAERVKSWVENSKIEGIKIGISQGISQGDYRGYKSGN
jgi:hypothetical protein